MMSSRSLCLQIQANLCAIAATTWYFLGYYILSLVKQQQASFTWSLQIGTEGSERKISIDVLEYLIKMALSSIVQNDLFVSAYYTQLKGVRDELMNYKSSSCTCAHQEQYIMQFLVGSNASQSHIHAKFFYRSLATNK